jgi:hypothetical protein
MRKRRMYQRWRKEKNFWAPARPSVGLKFGEGKNVLIKDNITRDVDPTSGEAEALETLMHVTISQENAFLRTKFKFAGVERPKMGPTRTSKDLQGWEVWFDMKQAFKGSGIV